MGLVHHEVHEAKAHALVQELFRPPPLAARQAEEGAAEQQDLGGFQSKEQGCATKAPDSRKIHLFRIDPLPRTLSFLSEDQVLRQV